MGGGVSHAFLSEFFPVEAGGWRRWRGHVTGWSDILLILVFSDIPLVRYFLRGGLFAGLTGGGHAVVRVVGAEM